MIAKSTAIVIKSFSYSDTSLISRLLLDNGEKMTVMIKGAKSMKSNKSALFQSMNLIKMDYYYRENRDMQMFKEGSLITSFSFLKNNFETMKYGLCIIDIIDKVLPKEYKDSKMFDIAYKCLKCIDDKKNHKMIFIFYLLSFSHYNGYTIDQIQFNSFKADEALNLFIMDDYDTVMLSMSDIDLDELIKKILTFIQSHILEIKNVKSLKFVN